ncbi:MAG: hypothetical protein LBM77_13010 [Spirochaetaceae bacterium]|jgi:hypothetical protein|nr:hypothetical protein [Spirochaetaceae bacterium]
MRRLLLLFLSLIILFTAYGEDKVDVELKLDFPLFDLPYQIEAGRTIGYGFFGSYASMSMNQSLAIATDLHSAIHFGMDKLYEIIPWNNEIKDPIMFIGNIIPVYIFETYLPFGAGWMGVEFRRSILSRFDVSSRTAYYAFGGYHIDDIELEQFKAGNPIEFTRMNSSYLEGKILFADIMQRNLFFYNLPEYVNITTVMTNLFVFGDLFAASTATYYPQIYKIIDNVIYKNDSVERTRGIAYIDSFNWVYDLFRPNEPYEVRGSHPSGNGIARYITWEQLDDDERKYLVTQGWLDYLNFASPILFGFRSFPLGDSGLTGNFALHHYLTSFGFDITANAYLKYDIFNMAFTLHNYINYQNYYFALEGELLDFPIRFADNFSLLLNPRVMIGMQPENQVFKTDNAEFFGLLGCRVDFAIGETATYLPYFEISAKTDGWVAGNEYLESNVSFAAGLSMRF